MKKLELYWPTDKQVINFPFGYKDPIYIKLGMIGHNGIDIDCKDGDPIYASHDGEVTYTGIDSNEGYGIVIRTNESFDYNGGQSYFKSISWHLRRDNGIAVKVGQKVVIGDIIGYGDNTGLSTGPHLHFGLKPIAKGENDWTWMNIEQTNGYFGAIDPGPYFTGQLASSVKKRIALLKLLVDLYQRLIKLLKI